MVSSAGAGRQLGFGGMKGWRRGCWEMLLVQAMRSLGNRDGWQRLGAAPLPWGAAQAARSLGVAGLGIYNRRAAFGVGLGAAWMIGSLPRMGSRCFWKF